LREGANGRFAQEPLPEDEESCQIRIKEDSFTSGWSKEKKERCNSSETREEIVSAKKKERAPDGRKRKSKEDTMARFQSSSASPYKYGRKKTKQRKSFSPCINSEEETSPPPKARGPLSREVGKMTVAFADKQKKRIEGVFSKRKTPRKEQGERVG